MVSLLPLAGFTFSALESGSLPAVIALVPYILRGSFFARPGEKRPTKEEKYRSAEGFEGIRYATA
jgi:hypothetical protein